MLGSAPIVALIAPLRAQLDRIRGLVAWFINDMDLCTNVQYMLGIADLTED